MKRTGGGRIIATSSIASLYNEPIVGTPYMPAKAGVAHLVRQAAMELGRYNILVNAIAPGPFVTNIAMAGSATRKTERPSKTCLCFTELRTRPKSRGSPCSSPRPLLPT